MHFINLVPATILVSRWTSGVWEHFEALAYRFVSAPVSKLLSNGLLFPITEVLIMIENDTVSWHCIFCIPLVEFVFCLIKIGKRWMPPRQVLVIIPLMLLMVKFMNFFGVFMCTLSFQFFYIVPTFFPLAPSVHESFLYVNKCCVI